MYTSTTSHQYMYMSRSRHCTERLETWATRQPSPPLSRCAGVTTVTLVRGKHLPSDLSPPGEEAVRIATGYRVRRVLRSFRKADLGGMRRAPSAAIVAEVDLVFVRICLPATLAPVHTSAAACGPCEDDFEGDCASAVPRLSRRGRSCRAVSSFRTMAILVGRSRLWAAHQVSTDVAFGGWFPRERARRAASTRKVVCMGPADLGCRR